MKQILKNINAGVALLGLVPVNLINTLRGLPYYIHDFFTLRKLQKNVDKPFGYGKPYPCLGDRFDESGSAKGHYFHQDFLIARKVFSNNPNVHVDVGSRIDGLITHIASFRKIEVFDIRPLTTPLPNVTFTQADLSATLNEKLQNYTDSLSCLHTIEHFGLGRYGDTVCPEAYKVGLGNLYNILKKDGKFYFSVPMGPQRIEFNAHRVFALKFLLQLFKGKYNIDSFSYVDDNGDLHENINLNDELIENNCGCHYGCGIFEMTKI